MSVTSQLTRGNSQLMSANSQLMSVDRQLIIMVRFLQAVKKTKIADCLIKMVHFVTTVMDSLSLYSLVKM
jgi:hypothetical protein